MLSTNRDFQYIGELKIKESKYLKDNIKPKDDKLNWLMLEVNNRKYSFIYKIEKPGKAEYLIPFQIKIWFLMPEILKKKLTINKSYKVYRDMEYIGEVKIIKEIT